MNRATLDFAVAIAREAGAATLPFFYADSIEVETKADLSPVTAADRASERVMRERIGAAHPRDSILGEEFGLEEGTTGRTWILDPIDGTVGFARRVPVYGVLVGVEEEGEAVAGVAHFPALGETVFAGSGLGASWIRREGGGAREARVSDVSRLADCCFCFTSRNGFKKARIGTAFDRLCDATKLHRGWHDCYGHMLVATGRADLMIDVRMAVWDNAALKPIVEEAGGRFTTLSGESTIRGGSAVSSNGRVHEETLALLRE